MYETNRVDMCATGKRGEGEKGGVLGGNEENSK